MDSNNINSHIKYIYNSSFTKEELKARISDYAKNHAFFQFDDDKIIMKLTIPDSYFTGKDSLKRGEPLVSLRFLIEIHNGKVISTLLYPQVDPIYGIQRCIPVIIILFLFGIFIKKTTYDRSIFSYIGNDIFFIIYIVIAILLVSICCVVESKHNIKILTNEKYENQIKRLLRVNIDKIFE